METPSTEPAATPPGRARRLPRAPRWLAQPRTALAAVIVCSVGARLCGMDLPGPRGRITGFVFDEKYYVNAARVIAGVGFPGSDTYHGSSPDGTDPNAEHPQLGKLVIAAGIRLLGDNAVGWRIGALLLGTLALLALHWLVRAAGGSPWLAVGATALMATENLELVHGRIAVLDVYALPFMLAGMALFLQRRPWLAGIAIGIGTDMKLFGGYALFAVLLFELGRFGAFALALVRRRVARPGWRRVLRAVLPASACVVATVATTLLVLAALDHWIPAYSSGQRVSADLRPWTHLRFMYDYGRGLRSPTGPHGIASYPWQFWIDVEPANYYTFNEILLQGTRTVAINGTVAYQGLVDPVILATFGLALPFGVWLCARCGDRLAWMSLAWVLATWLPALLAWLADQRTEYLYYMVVILPGVLVLCARLLAVRALPRVVLGIWIGVHAAAFCVLYPIRDWALIGSIAHLG